MSQQDYIFDIETTGLGIDEDFLVYADTSHHNEMPKITSDIEVALNRLLWAMEHNERIIGHNIVCFDLPWLCHYEYRTQGQTHLFHAIKGHYHQIYDTLIMSRKFAPTRKEHSLNKWGELMAGLYNIEQKVDVPDFKTASEALIAERCAGDVTIQAALWHYFVNDKGMPETVPDYEFDQAWIPVVMDLQYAGLAYDYKIAKEVCNKMAAKKFVPRCILNREFPEVNFNSNKQINEALIKKYGEGLPLSEPKKKKDGSLTKGGEPTLNKYNREEMIQKFPLLHHHFAIKDIDASMKYIDSSKGEDNKTYMGNHVQLSPVTQMPAVFPSLSFIGTRTGRMQYASPPLQQMAKSVREVNRVPKDWQLVGMDVVALEMSVLGYLLKELCDNDIIWNQVQNGESAKLLTLEAFGPVMTKTRLFGSETLEDVAKRVNYSLIYGIGLKTLAKQLNCESTTAIKRSVDVRFPNLERLNAIIQNRSFKNGVVKDMFGCKVVTEKWKALNAWIQSTGATYARRMMWSAWKVLKALPYEIYATVYNMDELQFLVPTELDIDPEYLKDEIMKQIKEDFKKEGLPIFTTIDIKIGRSWKETH